jgi:hypothetical protein
MSFTGIGNQNNRNKKVLPLRKVAHYSSWLSYPSIGCSPAVPTSVSLNLTNVLFLNLTQFSEQTHFLPNTNVICDVVQISRPKISLQLI